MGESFPISRAGMRSPRPTGSLDLTVGTGAVEIQMRLGAGEWRDLPRRCLYRPGAALWCRPTAPPLLFVKATALARAMDHHLARCMISRSRLPRPMPPNRRIATFGKPFGLALFCGTAKFPPRLAKLWWHLGQSRLIKASGRSGSRLTTPLQSRDHPVTTAIAPRTSSPGTGPKAGVIWKSSRLRTPQSFRPHLAFSRRESIRAFLPLRAKTSSRQSPHQVRRLAALSRLRPAALRSASPALCPTQSPRPQSQR